MVLDLHLRFWRHCENGVPRSGCWPRKGGLLGPVGHELRVRPDRLSPLSFVQHPHLPDAQAWPTPCIGGSWVVLPDAGTTLSRLLGVGIGFATAGTWPRSSM